MPTYYRAPRDIESRGRSRTVKRLNPIGFWQAATAGAAAAGSAALGFYNANKRPRPNSGPDSSIMPSSSSRSRSRSRMSVSRGRSMSRRTSRVRSRSRSRGGAGGGILSRQRDQRTTYRSGRRRGLRGRYGYRIENALCRMQPLQTWTSKASVNATSNVDQNGFFGCGLFTTRMTDQPDLNSIRTDTGLSAVTTGKFWIKSACLDVEIKNTGSVEVIMDIYTLVLRRDPEVTDNLYTQFTNLFNLQTPLTAANAADVANTVFQNPEFCKYWKTLSKREVMILPGEISALQMRRGKDKYVATKTITDNECGIPGTCKMYFFMWHGPPDPNASGAGVPGVGSTTVTFSYQKSYTYGLVPGPRTDARIHNS